jgi:hypothetical protein
MPRPALSATGARNGNVTLTATMRLYLLDTEIDASSRG